MPIPRAIRRADQPRAPSWHSDMRLTHKTYTDATCFSLFTELEKIGGILPSPIASPKSAFSGEKLSKVVPDQNPKREAEILVIDSARPTLATAVPDLPTGPLAERVGFEATHPLRQASDSSGTCKSGEANPSPLASLNSAHLGVALEKLVHAWPKLSPELRTAILSIISSAT